MKTIKGVCPVCGADYEKEVQRAVKGAGFCSVRREKRAQMRKRYDLPINDIECEKVKAERRKQHDRERHPAKHKEPDFKCKRLDCVYLGYGGDPTCDYLLRTGKRRGCPVENCIKYTPRGTI